MTEQDKKTQEPVSARPKEEGPKGKAKDKKAQGRPFNTAEALASLTPRERSLAFFTLCVVSFLLIDGIVMRPITQQVQKVNAEMKDKEIVVPKRLMVLKHNDRILREYEALSSYVTDKSLTQEEEIAQLLRDIERVSKQSGLFISNINPVQVDNLPEDRYQLSVSIEGEGLMDNIRRYIYILEHSNAAVRVSGFDLRIKKKDSDVLKYVLSIVKMGIREK